MKQWARLLFSCVLCVWIACSPAARSRDSFDQICRKVEGKTAAEVKDLLGAPDYQKQSDLGDEKWLWWNYTVLDGDSYAPEIRGQVVHLEITFSNPQEGSESSRPRSQWRVREPFGVSYLIPDRWPRRMSPASI
ncbi:MAG TPA: hypothetical protein VGP73_28475 [Thermoanaerobaculia bacterium]